MDNESDIDDFTNDFGFSFEEDNKAEELSEELDVLQITTVSLQQEVKQLDAKNRKIMQKITLLLNKLKSDPEKDVIRWPNRVEAIDKFLKELNDIYKEKPVDE